MSIISSASGSSCWRGLDYYKNENIKNLKKINDYELKEQLSKELMDKLPTEEEISLYLDIDETNTY